MWPEYVQAIWHVVPSGDQESEANNRQLDWILLPGLCCQAAGGDPEATKEVASAWLLLYTAAHIFDCIEDMDQLDEALARWGPGVNINIATGLLISASSLVNDFYQIEHTLGIARELGQDFFGSILQMASGQHADLTREKLKLNQWQEIAEAKSGAFFSLACRSGARLGTKERSKIEGFGDYGFQLGMMLQILDDMEDLKAAYDPHNPSLPEGIHCSLAVAYALEVLPDVEGRRLLNWISTGPHDQATITNVITLLEECGSTLYLQAELDRHGTLGLSALDRVDAKSPASEKLAQLINNMRTG